MHLVSPGVLLICSDSEPVQHRWGLMAVCKFPEERVNKVLKQPATSANLQDCGVKTQVHQDSGQSSLLRAKVTRMVSTKQRLWETCKGKDPCKRALADATVPFQGP